MNYQVTHTTKYTYAEPAAVCHNQVHLAPRQLPYQDCLQYRLLINPEPTKQGARVDFFGNRIDYFAIETAHPGLTITARSVLRVRSQPPAEDPSGPPVSELLKQLRSDLTDVATAARIQQLPSQLIPVGPAYAAYAGGCLPPGRPIVDGVQELTAKIHAEFRYDPRATTVSTPVAEVLKRRSGVCQDFAQFQVACLRSLGIPARYVSGYLRTLPPPGKPRLVGADASHAWVSVYCGRELGWLDFDPTNDMRTGTDHITVAWGRDYSDVCPIQGVFVGGGNHSMSVSVDVMPLESLPPHLARPVARSPQGA